MNQVRFRDETSVFFVESQGVIPLLVIMNWLERKRLILGNLFPGSPPYFHTSVFISNFFVIIHAQRHYLATVFDGVRLEPPCLGGGGGAQVGLDDGVGFAAHETLAGELVEGDLDVRREEREKFLSMFCDGVSELVGQILFSNCFHKHQSSYD